MTLFINEKHIAELHDRGLASMADYVAAMEGAYGDQGAGDFDILPRQNFYLPLPDKPRPASLKIAGASLRGVGVMGACAILHEKAKAAGLGQELEYQEAR